METLPLSELPKDLSEEISKDISDFGIGFVRLSQPEGGEGFHLIGSGTLVQIDDIYGILTAHHVLEKLPKDSDIGLILATRFSPQVHRMTLKGELLHHIKVSRGQNESEGPDLGFLVLPTIDAGKIKAKKSFYNLSLRIQRMDNPPENDKGVWFLFGFADELTIDKQAERGFARVKVFCGLVGYGWISNSFEMGEYDYFDFEIGYGGPKKPPESFGGFSGGGLWQVPLIRNKRGELEAKERLLSGVAFFQTAIKDNKCFIRCHGRRSIYQHAIRSIRNLNS